MNIADQIQHTQSVRNPWTSWFVYGDTGSGKTTLAATFPSPLFIEPANENSHIALLRLTERNIPFLLVGKNSKTRQKVPVRQHMNAILSYLEDQHRAMHKQLAARDQLRALGDAAAAEKADRIEQDAYALFPWETVVFESMTHYVDMCVEDIRLHKKKQIMDMAGWGELGSHLMTLHHRLTNLDVHTVYTALASQSDDGRIGPALSGRARKTLPSACAVLAYTETIPGNSQLAPIRRIHFEKRGEYDTRSRLPVELPAFIDNFNFAQHIEPKLG